MKRIMHAKIIFFNAMMVFFTYAATARYYEEENFVYPMSARFILGAIWCRRFIK